MLNDILEYGTQPGIIGGYRFDGIIKIGNAKTGDGEWLIIEADKK